MRVAKIAAIALVVGLCFSTAANAVETSVIDVGGWRISANVDDSGSFKYCDMGASYIGGTYIAFMLGNDYQWNLILLNDSWNLERGKHYPIFYKIDREAYRSADAVGMGPNTFMVSLPDDPALFNRFRYGNGLTISTVARETSFRLSGTKIGLTALGNCVANRTTVAAAPNSAAGLFASNQDTHSKVQPDSDVANAASLGAYKAESITLAANVLSASGLTGYKFVTPSTPPTTGADTSAIWISGKIGGILSIYDYGNTQTIEDTKSVLISSDAKNCKGKFVSGVDPSANNSGAVDIFTACDDESVPTATYTLLKRQAGGVYVFGVFDYSKSGGKSDGALSDSARSAAEHIRDASYQILTSK